MMSRRRNPLPDEPIPGIAYLLGAVVLAGLGLLLYSIAVAVVRGLA